MTGASVELRPRAIALAVLAVVLCVGVFLVEGGIGINLNDEGYIWYGTQRTAHGEVPMRDYQAYDPGRYYWGALWFRLLGDDGVVALRLSFALFQALGLTFGLLALRRVLSGTWTLLVAASILLVWMVPSYKAFEMTLALGAVLFGTRLVERPTLSRHFVAGAYCGLAACFGRNYGAYSAVAFLMLIALVQWRLEPGSLARRLAAWSGGMLAGYLPMLLMFLLVPGFFEGFAEMNLWMLKAGSTNRPRPVPWPWLPQYGSYLVMSPARAARHFLIGTFFVLLPLFPLAVGAALVRMRELRSRALLVAAAAVQATCCHYAFSRADPGHLASSIHPLLLGVMALPAARASWNRRAVVASVLLGLGAMSALSAGTEHPLYALADARGRGFVDRVVAGDRLTIRRSDAALIRVVRGLPVRPGSERPLFAAPIYPGLYPALGLKSPVWPLVFPLPETPERQKRILADLDSHDTEWAFLCDFQLDWSDELRLSNTHDLVWAHLTGSWELQPVSDHGLPDECQIRRRPRGGSAS